MPKVGDSLTVYAQQSYDPTSSVAGATWSVDSQDALKVALVPGEDGSSCRFDVHAPGAIRVTATLGAIARHLIIVATTAPAPGVNVTPSSLLSGVYYAGPYFFSGAPALVTSAAAWTQYWQAVATYTGSRLPAGYAQSLLMPSPPPIDFSQASLVLLGESFGSDHETPVISRVDATGGGRIEIGLPEADSEPDPGAMAEGYFQVIQVPKLPDTTQVVYDCRAQSGCAAPTAYRVSTP